MKIAIIFHQRAIPKIIKGDIVCSMVPLSINEWNKEIGRVSYRSFTDKINDTIISIKEDINNHSDSLDEYTCGYDAGYLAGLEYAKKIYEED